MKVACAQLRYRHRDVEPGLARIAANLEHLDGIWANRLAAAAPDLVVLGEFWLASPSGPEDYGSSAVAFDEQFVGLIGELARAHRVHLMANVIERDDDGRLFDSSIVVTPDARVCLSYREVAGGLLPGSLIATPVGAVPSSPTGTSLDGLGRWIPVADTELGRLCAVVGSDLAYPEIFAGAVLGRAEVVLHAAKEPRWAAGAWQSLKAARVLEGGFALVSCNIADDGDPWGESWGGSSIIDAEGVLVAGSTTAGEDVVHGEIDLDTCRAQQGSARLQRRRTAHWRQQCHLMFTTDN